MSTRWNQGGLRGRFSFLFSFSSLLPLPSSPPPLPFLLLHLFSPLLPPLLLIHYSTFKAVWIWLHLVDKIFHHWEVFLKQYTKKFQFKIWGCLLFLCSGDGYIHGWSKCQICFSLPNLQLFLRNLERHFESLIAVHEMKQGSNVIWL